MNINEGDIWYYAELAMENAARGNAKPAMFYSGVVYGRVHVCRNAKLTRGMTVADLYTMAAQDIVSNDNFMLAQTLANLYREVDRMAKEAAQ